MVFFKINNKTFFLVIVGFYMFIVCENMAVQGIILLC